jgi:hypothetical protein
LQQKTNYLKNHNLTKTINNYNIFIFISPHLDDAILSCGQLIIDLCKLKKKITIITVFTKASANTSTPQAMEFLKLCGHNSAIELFNERAGEDMKISRYLKIKSIHLNQVDAAWREDQNKKPIYKNRLIQMSGNVSPKDKKLVARVESKLKTIISKHKKALILGPCGIGGHIDHVIVSKILAKLPYPKLFWEDFPYNTKGIKRLLFFIFNTKFHRLFSVNNKSSEKERLIKDYKSQIPCLFPSGDIPDISERYYYSGTSKPS